MIIGLTTDIYFINRGAYHNVISFDQIQQAFATPPRGGTNIVAVLDQIQRDRINVDMGKPLIIHLFTDGHPTNINGAEDINGLTNWIRSRKFPKQTFYSIVLCTDDTEIERSYRSLETRYKQKISDQDRIDVTEDYRGELRDVQEKRGRRYRFTLGDYVVKILVGSFDPSIHNIDLPDSCCIIA